jgi:hypothetical protein
MRQSQAKKPLQRTPQLAENLFAEQLIIPTAKSINTEPMETMNTDTPETDGEWNRLAYQDHPKFERNLADFARKLERERDELRKNTSELIVSLQIEMDGIERELATERELADRLAALLQRTRDYCGGQIVDPECGCFDCEYLRPIDEALAARKEARSES